ncbi:MAG: hypothetical protein HWE24_17600, partial [Oceanospirillaceae bacterium]|nr:hypothetical protein [Oceanospirillaceae bacterium]
MRYNFSTRFSIFFFFISLNLCWADSPLTSIEFWRGSKDSYILKIGNKVGKQKLNKKMYNYLMNPSIDSFNKYSLINSLGWEYNTQVKNSDIFLNFFYKSNKKFDEFDVESLKTDLLELGEEYFFIYEYLKAMDYYLNVKEIKKELLNYIDVNKDLKSKFIYNLINLQDKSLDLDFCSVYNLYNNFISENCIEESSLKNSLIYVDEYISTYSRECNEFNLYLSSICNIDSFKANQNQSLFIINYPLFVFGTMEVF